MLSWGVAVHAGLSLNLYIQHHVMTTWIQIHSQDVQGPEEGYPWLQQLREHMCELSFEDRLENHVETLCGSEAAQDIAGRSWTLTFRDNEPRYSSGVVES